MPGSTPATSQLDWLSSTTAMIVLSWSKATRDLLKSFSWGIGALRQLFASDDGAISFAACPIPSLCWRELDSNFRFRARRNREILVSRRSSTDLVWLRPPEGLGALAPRVEEFGDAGSCYLLLTINKGTV